MGWNGSEGVGEICRRRNASVSKAAWGRVGTTRAIVWVVVVLVLGGLCIWWMLLREGERHALRARDDVHNGGKIEEVEPVKVEKSQENVQTNRWPEKAPYGDGEWRHGEGPRSIAVTNGNVVTYPHYPHVRLILPHPAFAAPFRNLPDNEIARILSSKPGDTFIDFPLPKDFDKRFAKSLDEPIIINDDDPPEKVELKKQVIEARKTLADAMKRGESPRAILEADAKELRRLMDTRANYQRIIDEEIKRGASDQDIADIVKAANKALEQKGIDAKVQLPYKTKLRINKEKAAGRILD